MDWISAIEARANAATPGPWKYDYGNWDVEGLNRENICDVSPGYRMRESNIDFHPSGTEMDDGEFIAHARTDIPKLVKALRVAIGALKFECNNKCAIGINPCNAREALDEIELIGNPAADCGSTSND